MAAQLPKMRAGETCQCLEPCWRPPPSVFDRFSSLIGKFISLFTGFISLFICLGNLLRSRPHHQWLPPGVGSVDVLEAALSQHFPVHQGKAEASTKSAMMSPRG
jgi:hypothetical protein